MSYRPHLEPLEERRLLAVITVTGAGDSIAVDNLVTLREAITSANNNANVNTDVVGVGAYGTGANTDTINFNINLAGVQTITVGAGGLPVITGSVLIDGYTQPGSSVNTLAVGNDAVLLIELNGNGAAFNALTITAGNSTVRGLVINRFDGGNSLLLQTGGGNTITGNFIGTNAAGTALLGTGVRGLLVTSNGNQIGGTTPEARNVIAINTGIQIASPSNTVQGNYVGTNAAGTALLPAAGNSGVGVSIEQSAGNRIGGTDPGAGNVIGGFAQGVRGTFVTGSFVQGNYIGTNPAGAAGLGNGIGIWLQGNSSNNNNTIGGTATGAGNVISGNTGSGVLLSTGAISNNRVQGNLIGLAPDGTTPLGNGGHGVEITPGDNNVVGGLTGLLVANFNNGGVLSYEPTTGAFLGAAIAPASGALSGPEEAIFGPDGNLYVASYNTNQVLRYSGTTGAFLGIFVAVGSSGGLSLPQGLIFGPDGNLYVSSSATNQVLRYNGTTGAFLNVFASGGGLNQPDGVLFGRDGHLYVAGTITDAVLRYDGSTGAFLDTFASGDGLDGPEGFTFGPDGHLYVSSTFSNQVKRFNGASGAFIDNFASNAALTQPLDVDFGPDGNLYVSGFSSNNVVRFNGTTGAFIDVVVPAGSGGLNGPTYLTFSNAANTIANNGGDGVFVSIGAGNAIGSNSIYSNAGLGIDLGANGPTANDNLDPDTGPNNLQNFPVLTSLDATTLSTTLQGSLNSTANTSFRVEVFASDEHDPSHFGEGQTFLGFINVTTNASGNASFSFTAVGDFLGKSISTTATNTTTGETSEFSAACEAIDVVGTNFMVTNTLDSGVGSLRQAITDANANAGTDTITFCIPGTGVQTIAPSSPGLPPITSPVIIDGYSQPGATENTQAVGDNAKLLIELNGNGDVNLVGLSVRTGGDGSEIRGLVINRWGAGINIAAQNVTVQGNFIGTNAAGSAGLGGGFGINVTTNSAANSGNSLIGGDVPAARNLISSGISLNSNLPNVVQGNYIGTDASGNADVSGSGAGISIASGPAGATIGGLTATPGTGAGNVISGNNQGGIAINTSGPIGIGAITIQGNLIGLNASGTTILLNGNAGIINTQSDSTRALTLIGGTAPGARNVISGSTFGIQASTTNTVVQGNYIGTDITGTLDRGNGTGIFAYGQAGFVGGGPGRNITIGGGAAGAGNVISGNDSEGIKLIVTSATIQGNFIGTQADGVSPLPSGTGIDVQGSSIFDLTTGSSVIVGGAAVGEGNVIAFSLRGITLSERTTATIQSNSVVSNRERGIVVAGDSTRAAILGNSIFNNGTASAANDNISKMGIDLTGNAGITPNDTNDPDPGPNALQNFPVLTSATTTGGTTTIAGTLNSTPGGTFRLEFFANAADPSGFGAGQTYLGFKNVTTDGNGNVTFTTTGADGLLPIAAGQRFVTATATDLTLFDHDDNSDSPMVPRSNTSEFSAKVDVAPGQGPSIAVGDVTVTEGDSDTADAVFRVTLSQPTDQTVTVILATANGSAGATDYQSTTVTLTFTPMQTSKNVTVKVTGDLLDEPNETFVVNLSGESNATVSDGQGQGTIEDDDDPPSLSINNASATEGDSGTADMVFTVSLSAPSGRSISVAFATAHGTAGSDDYQSITGSFLSFSPLQTSKNVTVKIIGDLLDEPNETFAVNLSGESNATVSDGQGQGTIADDDEPPSLSINDRSVREGDSGTVEMVLTVTLSAPSAFPVSVQVATEDRTAESDDYQSISSSVLSFAPLQVSQTLTVRVNGDMTPEPDETFVVLLSNSVNASIDDGEGRGTIDDDDDFSVPAILVVGPDAGKAPLVRVFDAATSELLFEFFAYDPRFTGGVRVAVGDVNGDGTQEIITAAGRGGGPHLRVFDGATGERLAGPVGNFFAYARNFTGGVFVAAGDVNGDGAADIVTGADFGGGPHVRVFDGRTGEQLPGPIGSFLAYKPHLTAGVRVAAGDVDGDGLADVITGMGAGYSDVDRQTGRLGQTEVRVFSGATGGLIRSFVPFEAGYRGGVHLGVVHFDADSRVEIIVSKANGDNRTTRAFDAAYIDPFRRGDVSIFKINGAALPLQVAHFEAYGNFGGSVRVAALDEISRDVDPDDYTGLALFTGAGPGGGPQARLRADNLTILDSFFAYEQDFKGGIWVAAG